MYFLNLKGLTEQLSKAPLKNREMFHYLAGVMFWTLFERSIKSAPSSESDLPFATHLLLSFSIGGLILWAGLKYLYRQAGGEFGEDFLPNVVALSFVAGNRLALVVLPCTGVLLLAIYLRVELPFAPIMPMVYMFFIITALLWWVQSIGRGLREIHVARQQRISSEVPL